MRGQRHAPAALYPPGKTWYPFYRRLGGPQSRSRQVRKISPPPGFDPRTIHPVACRYIDYATRPINCSLWSTNNVSCVIIRIFRLNFFTRLHSHSFSFLVMTITVVTVLLLSPCSCFTRKHKFFYATPITV
jgi:hypothetical protein